MPWGLGRVHTLDRDCAGEEQAGLQSYVAAHLQDSFALGLGPLTSVLSNEPGSGSGNRSRW